MTQPGDRLALRGVRARGYHGVLESERLEGQVFVVDVELELDLARAGASDELADTVDYGSLAQRLVAVVEGEPVALIETLAERLAAACLQDVRVQSAQVTLHKPQAPVPVPFEDVAVTIRRRRQ